MANTGKDDDVINLYQEMRPRVLDDIVGQDETVKSIKSSIEKGTLSRAIMLWGPSGTGKTTIAHVIRRTLGCKSKNNYTEINAASARGIDTAREIVKVANQKPWTGKYRFFICDESHRLTPEAQDALLVPFETPPQHAFFILCTTVPSKVVRTLRGRCAVYGLSALKAPHIKEIIARAIEKKGYDIPKSVQRAIVESANGSGREALVFLQKAASLDSEEAMLAVVKKLEEEQEAVAIARALLDTKTTWRSILEILAKTQEDPETLRRIIRAYVSKIILGHGKEAIVARSFQILNEMESSSSFDMGSLLLACTQLVKKK